MQKWSKSPPETTRIAVVLFDRFSNLCLANCLEPLRAANTLTKQALFSWQFLTMSGDPAYSSSDLQVLPQAPLSQLTECDYLYILASYDHLTHDTMATRRALRTASRKAKALVGFDAAPWLMASAGLLNGKRVTLHWDLLDAFSEKFLDTEAEQVPIARDGPMITCAGAMSALDHSLDLISRHAGVAARLDVEALFISGDQRTQAERHNQTISDPLVRKALESIRKNLETPLDLKQLSGALGCQPRTLDRHFRAVLGAPPGTVYRHLRLSQARKLLEGGSQSVAEVAVRCGYESPAALTRAIRQKYAFTPSQLRRLSGKQPQL